MKRPKSDIGQAMLAAEEERLWGRALFWGIVAIGGAFFLAWAWQDDPWLAPPEGGETSVLALYQTALTGIAATALLIPAFAVFLFRNRAPRVWRLWEAFWTVSYVAFLVHIGWAVFVYHRGDWSAVMAASHVPYVWPAVALALWWPLDLWLASREADERWWDGGQRLLLHAAVLGVALHSAAWQGQTLLAKIAGFALAGATLASGFDAWRKWQRRRAAE